MNKRKKIFKSGITLVVSLLFFTGTLKTHAQTLRLPGNANFNLSSMEIRQRILSDSSIKMVKDFVSDSSYLFFVSKQSDSVDISFVKTHLAKIDVLTKDSCYFMYVKAFCYENMKRSKPTDKYRKSFSNKEYSVMLVPLSDNRYRILFRSKKHPIRM